MSGEIGLKSKNTFETYTRLLGQTEDGLLLPEESRKVIEIIKSDDFTKIALEIAHILENRNHQEDGINFGKREVFSTTRQSSIDQALSDSNERITNIIDAKYTKWDKINIPMFTLMALSLNQVLVNLADNGEINNISNNGRGNHYRIRVSIGGKGGNSSKSYNKQSQPEALRKALKRRNDLFQERKKLKNYNDGKKELIRKGILIDEGNGYKIAQISYKMLSGNRNYSLIYTSQIKQESIILDRSDQYKGEFELMVGKLATLKRLTTQEKDILLEHASIKYKHRYAIS